MLEIIKFHKKSNNLSFIYLKITQLKLFNFLLNSKIYVINKNKNQTY